MIAVELVPGFVVKAELDATLGSSPVRAKV